MLDKFSYINKGYDPYEVYAYIEKIEEMLKSYKQKDSAINNAIVSAQIAADNIIREANIKASQMLSETELKLEQMKNMLAMQKSILDSFYNDYNELVHKYLSNLNENDMLKMYTKINSLEEKINSLKSTQLKDNSENTSDVSRNPVKSEDTVA